MSSSWTAQPQSTDNIKKLCIAKEQEKKRTYVSINWLRIIHLSTVINVGETKALMTDTKLLNNHQCRPSSANDLYEYELKLKDHQLPFGKGDGTVVEEILEQENNPGFFFYYC